MWLESCHWFLLFLSAQSGSLLLEPKQSDEATSTQSTTSPVRSVCCECVRACARQRVCVCQSVRRVRGREGEEEEEEEEEGPTLLLTICSFN